MPNVSRKTRMIIAFALLTVGWIPAAIVAGYCLTTKWGANAAVTLFVVGCGLIGTCLGGMIYHPDHNQPSVESIE